MLERTEPKINGINHKNEIRAVKTAGNIKMTVGQRQKFVKFFMADYQYYGCAIV